MRCYSIAREQMSKMLLYLTAVAVPCVVTMVVMACLRYVPQRWRHVDVGVEMPFIGIEVSVKEGESRDSD